MMRKALSISLILTIVLVLVIVLLPAGAGAFALEWSQADWSGGPGQILWEDTAKYNTSFRIDTTSVPGTMRLSHTTGAAYTKEAANPVVSTGAAGSWEDSYVQGWPRKKEGGGYELMYTGINSTPESAVGYADSTDGINWTKFAANPVIQKSGTLTWDHNGVKTGPLVANDDTNRMFFEGFNSGNAVRYGLATSPDMKAWSRGADFVFGSGTAGSWDVELLKAGIYKVGNGYMLWYIADDTPGAAGAGKIGYATSPDGSNWTKNAGNPVVNIGSAGSFDETSLDDLLVIPRQWSGDYLMLYLGRNAGGANGIGIATSPDGVNWTKNSGNPVITTGVPGSWYQNDLYILSGLFDGSLYKLALYGQDAGSNWNSGEAWSDGGLNWTMNPNNPLISTTPAPAWDDSFISANIPFLEGDRLRTFYLGNGTGAPMSVGTATANPSYMGDGILESSVYDAKATADWGVVTWDETKPADTSVQVQVRCGDVKTPDGTWTGWAGVTNGGAVSHSNSRYIQYRVLLATTDTVISPQVSEINIEVKPLMEWYLAEGSTGSNELGNFETWVLVQNPGDDKAHIKLFYQTPAGETNGPVLTVEPHTRTTVNVAETVPGEFSVSTRVTTDNPVIAERAMYWNSAGGINRQAAHDSIGVLETGRQWFLAEGSTGTNDHGTFETWILVQNPGGTTANADIFYQTLTEEIPGQHLTLAPHTRQTVNVADKVPNQFSVSTRIESDSQVIAERAMYWNSKAGVYRQAAHDSIGVVEPDTNWYLAEGSTGTSDRGTFETWILVQNAGANQAEVDLYYQTPTEEIPGPHLTLAPHTRKTVNVAETVPDEFSVSTRVTSDNPVIAERAMYWNSVEGINRQAAHGSIGSPLAGTSWYLAEGSTGTNDSGSFECWILIQNPGDDASEVDIFYQTPTEEFPGPHLTIAPHTRKTINVGDTVSNQFSVSTRITATLPVIAERAMYWNSKAGVYRQAAHDSIGLDP